MVVLASGGVAYAAEGTLPGDTLYPVKVSVLEPIRTALTFSPTAQIQWHITLAERRISEATALANEGKLSSTTEATLAANFSANANAATQAIGAQETNDPLDAVVATTNFSAQLGGYETVLAQIDSNRDSNTGVLREAIRAQIALSDQTTVSAEPPTSSAAGFRTGSSTTVRIWRACSKRLSMRFTPLPASLILRPAPLRRPARRERRGNLTVPRSLPRRAPTCSHSITTAAHFMPFRILFLTPRVLTCLPELRPRLT